MDLWEDAADDEMDFDEGEDDLWDPDYMSEADLMYLDPVTWMRGAEDMVLLEQMGLGWRDDSSDDGHIMPGLRGYPPGMTEADIKKIEDKVAAQFAADREFERFAKTRATLIRAANREKKKRGRPVPSDKERWAELQRQKAMLRQYAPTYLRPVTPRFSSGERRPAWHESMERAPPLEIVDRSPKEPLPLQLIAWRAAIADYWVGYRRAHAAENEALFAAVKARGSESDEDVLLEMEDEKGDSPSPRLYHSRSN